uniref:AP-1 complex subunit gamma-1 n=2 Tax=Schizosaccharomyces pombe (strain 972 / ATCC 24843) TaxID=284812 RepID=AP1G1_SCHPO|nr:AP-1 adaptor complex gamma subunit Apl4 [Schizosaccharomyces pombe]Q9UU81.1 RecName: Full=AP-1 complex subunit gamma-1; AltName: Full=Clathrin assembly protein complex 1 gamma-1 large chain; AltName: Full=Clathrin assembly protein large gamma-1 chain; AltName: Full=Gamma-adaptin [Schizosaccharomyces pombe 972h-]CAB54865.1 AP-1 adaptor complex gamma subunit Apl4 [Schizosaccharomyces pombe]|eukprot:NP_588559.1 AP-1 adaptor complex gamma subunit Apl4 [Schizosaccharomyces pombe]
MQTTHPKNLHLTCSGVERGFTNSPKTHPKMSSLKSFIKAVRASKTTAEEHTTILKESAQIRKNIRQGSNDMRMRRKNVAKLLYLFLLGEPTHFGQIECLKLLSSSRFMDKRLGYLAAMLLLDENQEVLTLLTNSLQNDLKSRDKFIVGLALSAFGNVAGPELARDLSNDIAELCSNHHNYISKKAVLCALRVIQKEPDLESLYIEKTDELLHSKSHGVLMAALAFAISACKINPSLISRFESQADDLIYRIRQLSTSTYSSEHNIGNISDPFLQVKILQFLSILGQNNPKIYDKMSDLLAQVCTNTDSSRNAGNAILYQAVRTILDLNSDSSLRVLGVNILAKFLGNRDNNTRYVALNMLKLVVNSEENAVQRHRSTILACLNDVDSSIQSRALELSTFLVNEANVRFMVRELLSFLDNVSDELRGSTAQYITEVTNAFAPNKRWHFDTLLRVFKSAGNFVSESTLSTFLRLIASAPELHEYAVVKLYAALKEDVSQEALTLSAFWVIGEYGQMLLSPTMNFDDDQTLPHSVSESDIVDIIEEVFNSVEASRYIIVQYGLFALTKLSARLGSSSTASRIDKIIYSYKRNKNTEVQQRSVEFHLILNDSKLSKTILEPTPAPLPPPRTTPYQNAEQKLKANKHVEKRVQESNELLDLIGLTTPSVAEPLETPVDEMTQSPQSSLSRAPSTSKKSHFEDILGLFASPAPSAQPVDSLASSFASLDFNASASQPSNNLSLLSSIPSTSKSYPPIVVFDKHDVTLTLVPSKEESTKTAVIEAKFKNKNPMTRVEKIHLEVAVPKSQKLKIQPLRTTSMEPGGETSQTLRVHGPSGSQVKLRLRISVVRQGGSNTLDQVDFGKLPSDLLQ